MPKVTGQADLSAFLGALPAKLEQGILRGAMRAGARVIADDAQANARSKEITVEVKTKAEPGLITARVQVAGKGSYLAWWLEHGTAAHLIAVSDEDRGGRTVRRINKLAREGSLEIAGKFVGPVVHHPGAKPYPFMRPALDRQQGAAMAAAAAYVGAHLTKAGIASPQPADDEG